MVLTFSRSVSIWYDIMMWYNEPQEGHSGLMKDTFFSYKKKLVVEQPLLHFTWSSSVCQKITMPSRYTIVCNLSRRTSLSNNWNETGALVRPKGITRYSSWPLGAVECRFLFIALRDPDEVLGIAKFCLVKMHAPCSNSNAEEIIAILNRDIIQAMVVYA